jgi:hypothetical protein
MVTHHPDPISRNGDVEGGVAGLVTREKVGLDDSGVVHGDEPGGVTADHVIPRDTDDTLDVVALVQVNG